MPFQKEYRQGTHHQIIQFETLICHTCTCINYGQSSNVIN